MQRNLQDISGQKIKRGIDFGNRVGSRRAKLDDNFPWWDEKSWSKTTFFFLSIVFLVNAYLVYPLFQQDIQAAFTSSAILTVTYFVEALKLATKEQFLVFVTMSAVFFAPVSVYFFVRKISGHELAAFLATMIFILPNPLSREGLPLVGLILQGDGAHALMFAIMPFLILLAQSFISTGISVYGVMAAIVTAGFAIISPFALFNVLILFLITFVGESFLGSVRVKTGRMLFLVASSFALAAFWYFPNVFVKILSIDHVGVSVSRIVNSLPLAIPLVPVIGTVSFLIFDRRAKLKPLFIATAIVAVYYCLFLSSRVLKISGLFTAERYLPELILGLGFLASAILAPALEVAVRKLMAKSRILLAFCMATAIFASLLFLKNSITIFDSVHKSIQQARIRSVANKGIGSLARGSEVKNLPSVTATSISFATLLLFLFIIIRHPAILRSEN